MDGGMCGERENPGSVESTTTLSWRPRWRPSASPSISTVEREPDPHAVMRSHPLCHDNLKSKQQSVSLENSSSFLPVLFLLCLPQLIFHRAKRSCGCLLAQFRNTYSICQCSTPTLQRISISREAKAKVLQGFTLQPTVPLLLGARWPLYSPEQFPVL